MIVELLYTSAPQGLKQGSRGFCTVVCTSGLPINLAQRLESLSAYRHLYQPGDPKSDRNPVCYSHLRFGVGGRTISVLSRIAAYGVDYSQRTNKIAHHLVFDDALPRCGPVAILDQPGVMRSEWDGQCRTLAAGPPISDVPQPAAPCLRWQQVAGDAGWAGVIANAWLKAAPKPTWIIFAENQSEHLCELMREAVALLPEKSRSKATFSTYCTNLPPDVDCKVRCVVAGSDEARMSIARGEVVDLTKKLGPAPNTLEVKAARQGQMIGGEEKRVVPTTQPIQALSASSIPAAEAVSAIGGPSELDNLEAYELQSIDLIGPPTAAPKKLPPRPLVPPKHMKVPKPVSVSANPVNPAWFIAGTSAVIATLLIAVTVIVLMRQRQTAAADQQALHSGSSADTFNQNANTLPSQIVEPPPKLPDKTTPQPESIENSASSLKPPPKLICTPAVKEMGADEVKHSQIAQLSFEGSDKPIDPSKIRVLRNGEAFTALSVLENGQLSWDGDKPELKSTEEIFNLEIFYSVRDATPSATFALKLKACEGPDLDFKIIDNTHKLTEGFALGSELSPEFTRDRDADELEPGKNRQWTWERSDLDKDNWTQVSDKDKFIVSLADVHKRLRVKLSYATRNNNGRTEIPPKIVTILPASTWRLSIADILNKPENLKAKVDVVPPKLDASGTIITSYGVDKANVDRNYFEVLSDRIVKKPDTEKVMQKFLPLNNASRSYGDEVKKFKNMLQNGKGNLVVQVLNNGLSLRDIDSLEAKCEIAKERRKLQLLLEKILKTAELISKREIGKELTGEESAELNQYVGTYAGYPQSSNIKPMQAAQPHDRQAAILEFNLGWQSSLKSQWESMVTTEQAFLTALESARSEPYLFESEGKIKIEQRTPKKTLIQCPLAVRLIVTFSPKLEQLLRELSPGTPGPDPAGSPAVNTVPQGASAVRTPPKTQ